MENVKFSRDFWLSSPAKRLSAWRTFRRTISEKSVDDVIPAIWRWWQMAPEVSISIDPYDPKAWPTLWEIIQQGACCKYSRSLATSYTIYYLFPETSNQVIRVHDLKKNDIYSVSVIDERFLLSPFNTNVQNLDDFDINFRIEECWNIQDVMDLVLHGTT
jgi:hypothetical protein